VAKRKKGPAPGTAPKKRKPKKLPPGFTESKPRKKKAAKKAPKAKKAKKPCKYGARIDGLCPKKPRTTRAQEDESLTQKVLGKKVAIKGKRSQQVRTVITSAATKGAESAVRTAFDKASKAYETDPSAFVSQLKRLASALIIPGLVIAAFTGAKAIERAKAERFALRELERTSKALKRPLSEREASTLSAQYVGFVKQKFAEQAQRESKVPAVRAKAEAAIRFLNSI